MTSIHHSDAAGGAIADQIAALDAKWTREFKGLKASVTKIEKSQRAAEQVAASQATSILRLENEVGRLKPLTEEEQRALANLVSSQLAQQIIRRWVGSIKGKVIGTLAAIAMIVTLAASVANLLRHGF